MPRAKRLCPKGHLVDHGKPCAECRRDADRARGNRGYSSAGHRSFREAVLARDPFCVIDGCTAWASVADHWPLSRRELIERGLDPDDPAAGRGLCKPHHDRSTAERQPGGWNVR